MIRTRLIRGCVELSTNKGDQQKDKKNEMK